MTQESGLAEVQPVSSENHHLLFDNSHSNEFEIRELRSDDIAPSIPSELPPNDNIITQEKQAEYRPPVLGRFKSSSLMILFLLVGALTALSQHFFYSHVDGRPPQQVNIPQIWVIRIGTALAFLFKTSLVASIGIAFCQRSWFSFQRDAISVDGIDAIFGVLRDPLKFFVADLLLRTKALTFLALISWILPLSAIFSPASLTVIATPQVAISPVQVPVLGSLNGSAGFYEFSSLTPPTFGGPTPQLKRLATRVFTSGEIIYWPSPCGINCTYTVAFEGPAYNCVDYYNPSQLVGDLHVLFAAGEALINPPSGFNYTNITSQYQVSDGIWLNRTIFANSTVQSTHCMLYAANYTTTVVYTQNIPSISSDVVLTEPIYSSSFADLVRMELGQIPANDRSLTLTNFYAIEQAVEDLLAGFLVFAQNEDGGGINGTSDVQLWSFVTYQTISPPLVFPDNFSQKMEELLINTTLSLVYFLNNPLPPQDVFTFSFSHDVLPATNVLVNATIASFPTLYSYSPRTLWVIYGISLGVSAVCVVFGCLMLLVNGVDADLSFSQVLVTTRNTNLDRLSHGSCLGGATISPELRKTKLKFGELNYGFYEDSGYGHACFGLENEIIQITKGKVYMGMKEL